MSEICVPGMVQFRHHVHYWVLYVLELPEWCSVEGDGDEEREEMGVEGGRDGGGGQKRRGKELLKEVRCLCSHWVVTD